MLSAPSRTTLYRDRDVTDDPWQTQRDAFGTFLRSQRRLANLSLREMAERTKISNAYLSQIERGLHEPSVRVLKAIANALNVSAESLLVQAGLLDLVDPVSDGESPSVEAAVRDDKRLTDEQRVALLAVYRSYIAANVPPDAAIATDPPASAPRKKKPPSAKEP
jgi:transcriptional regulator with XRE-family HTH domain